ncbi:MAG: PolC-type DNA polymerase III, partial [Bulleidia sp.]
PLANYTTFVALGSVPSMNRVKEVQKRIIAMADKLHIPVVADSDAHYCTPDQKIFRDVYIMSQGVGGATHPLYIRDEALRVRTPNPDQHIRLTNEMLDAFSWLEDSDLVHRIVIENPHKIFDSLEEVRPVPSGTYPPTIPGSDDKLREICYSTMKEEYEFEGKVPDIVKDRLDTELENIIRNGFGVHYYIAHLLVKKSNADGYIVGSRGSVGSSFTATMSRITEVNALPPHYLCPKCHYSEFLDDPGIASGFDLPDKRCPHCGAVMRGNGHNIPFQTFLGFNADKTPDIDLNFSNEYQAHAHAFIKEVFNDKHAFRAGTIGTVAEKTAYGYVSGYCEKMEITDMRRPMKDYLAKGCQNVKRTTGQHPGGIIIIPEGYDAEDFTPVQYPANDPNSEWKTTHYDFHDIHDNVLKFDILGHVDPTAMRLLQNISKTKPTTIPMNDPEVLSLFYCDDALKADPRVYKKETGALGLPEFGTRTTRKVLEETRPKCFSDLVIISGLSHGTDVWAGNAESLIQEGTCTLSEVIGCRDDIMTYLLNKGLEPLMAFKTMEGVRKGKGLTPEQEAAMREHNVPDWYIGSCKKIK